MPSLADIRKKISSVKSTQKITSAMKLVAASKLRRAQESITAARPYALEIGSILHRVAAGVPTQEGQAPHPLLETHNEPKRILVMVLTSDRGLCGGFNASVLKQADAFIKENDAKYEVLDIGTIGRRGHDHYKKQKVATVKDYPGVFNDLTFRRATEIAEGISQEYMNKDLDAVYLLYNEFKSAMTQIMQVQQVLPIQPMDSEDEGPADYIYESSQVAVLNKLAPRYLAIQIWRALLESSASEHGARMTAMDSATKNAKDMEDDFTLQYNRARQAAITRELMEIISGAEALSN